MFLLFHTIHVIIFLSIDKPFLLFRNTLKKKTFAPSPTGGNNSKQKEREKLELYDVFIILYFTRYHHLSNLGTILILFKYPQKKKLLHLALPGETILNKKREK
jgi:hypothetical protein